MSIDYNIMDELIKKKFPNIDQLDKKLSTKESPAEQEKNEEENPSDNISEAYDNVSESYRAEKLKNDKLENENIYRNQFVNWTIRLVTVFLFVTGCIVVFHRGLSDSIKITLLGTTTATVIGLPLVIVKGLFDNKDKK